MLSDLTGHLKSGNERYPLALYREECSPLKKKKVLQTEQLLDILYQKLSKD